MGKKVRVPSVSTAPERVASNTDGGQRRQAILGTLEDLGLPTVPLVVSDAEAILAAKVDAVLLAHADEIAAAGEQAQQVENELLRKEFGRDYRDNMRDYAALKERIARKEAERGKGVYVVGRSQVDALAAEAAQQRAAEVGAAAERQRLSVQEIIRYSARRAFEEGYEPRDIWSQDQGRRAARWTPLKEARQRIVVELRDMGATQRDIGAVFANRTKQSVIEIEKKGRALPKKEASNG